MLDKHAALTVVYSVGLDMSTVPGEMPAESINSPIAEKLAIGFHQE